MDKYEKPTAEPSKDCFFKCDEGEFCILKHKEENDIWCLKTTIACETENDLKIIYGVPNSKSSNEYVFVLNKDNSNAAKENLSLNKTDTKISNCVNKSLKARKGFQKQNYSSNCINISDINTCNYDYHVSCKRKGCSISSKKKKTKRLYKCNQNSGFNGNLSYTLKNIPKKHEKNKYMKKFIHKKCSKMMNEPVTSPTLFSTSFTEENQINVTDMNKSEKVLSISDQETTQGNIIAGITSDVGLEKIDPKFYSRSELNKTNLSSFKHDTETNSTFFNNNNSFFEKINVNHRNRIPKSAMYSLMNFHFFNIFFVILFLLILLFQLMNERRSFSVLIYIYFLYFIVEIFLNEGNII